MALLVFAVARDVQAASWQVISSFDVSPTGALVVQTDVQAATTWELYPPDDPSLACLIDVGNDGKLLLSVSPGAPCKRLVTSLVDGSVPVLLYGIHGRPALGAIRLDIAPLRDASVHAEVMSAKLSLETVRTDGPCYLVLTRLVELNCRNGNAPLTKEDVEITKEALKRGDKPFLIAKVRDADATAGTWRRVPVALPRTNDGGGGGEARARDFQARCEEARTANKDKLHDRYVVCADVYAAQRNVDVYSCDAAGKCAPSGENVKTNHQFTVFMWTDKGNTVVPTLDGAAGSSSGIYEPPPKKAGTGNGVTPPPEVATTWVFGARKAGTAKLTVIASKAKDAGGTTEVGRAEYTFTVEDSFYVLPRLGLGFSYQPNGSVIGIRSTNDGQRYSARTQGPGTYNLEILAGMTYMLTPVRQDSHDVSAGLGVRFGLASVAGDPKLLTSAMGGLEFAIGTDIAIGFYMGLFRNEAPDNNYEVGKLLPATQDKIPTHMVWRQSFALVIDFMPSVSKTVGLAK